MSQNIMTLSNEWARRPMDQRYTTLAELHAAVLSRKETSRVTDAALEHLRVMPADDSDTTDMVLLAPPTRDHDGNLGTLTNYAFGQLCARAQAPAAFLRKLPPMLAAASLQWQMEHTTDREDGKVLSRVNGSVKAACVTSPTYGRIWDSEVTGAIVKHIDPTQWKVPGASYAARDPKRATTLYASDRDVFLFLCNETAAIEVPGEGPKFRGIIVSNSEVGAGRFYFASMLYDRVCDNRIIWGATDFREVAIRHTSGAPMRFIAEAAPKLRGYLDASPRMEAEVIVNAQNRIVGKDKESVVSWLRSRGFSQTLSGKAYDNAEREGIRNPRSLWGVVSGLTEAAHEVKWTDERVDLETKASELLDLAR